MYVGKFVYVFTYVSISLCVRVFTDLSVRVLISKCFCLLISV